MDFGVTGKLWEYGIDNRTSAMAKKNIDAGFAEIAAEKAAGMSFKDMWQVRFPGAYYHTMNGNKIPQSVWDRTDFPMEKFFRDDLDESVLDWKQFTGAVKMEFCFRRKINYCTAGIRGKDEE